MQIDNEFGFGDIVYLKTDPDQLARIITGISVHPEMQIIYKVSYLGSNTEHYSFELSMERDIVKATTN
jgi:hypothetical protein